MNKLRLNIWLDEELRGKMRAAAAKAGAAEGQPISVSEWTRRAIIEKLDTGSDTTVARDDSDSGAK